MLASSYKKKLLNVHCGDCPSCKSLIQDKINRKERISSGMFSKKDLRIEKENQKFKQLYRGDICDLVDVKKINETIRKYMIHSNEFKKVGKQIKNLADVKNDMDYLRNSVEAMVKDVNLIRMAQFFIF